MKDPRCVAGVSHRVTRRDVLAAASLTATLGHGPRARLAIRRLRIGFIEPVAGDPLPRLDPALRGLGLSCSLVPLPSWGSLLDHLANPGPLRLDGALLPAGAAPADVLVLGALPADPASAAILLAPGWPGLTSRGAATAARALADAEADAALAGELRGLRLSTELRLRVVPPAMLLDNVAAGLFDAVLVTGGRARTAVRFAAERGLRCHLRDGAAAAALTPALSIVVRRSALAGFVSA